jgi:hypothetical protein
MRNGLDLSICMHVPPEFLPSGTDRQPEIFTSIHPVDFLANS